MFCITIGNTDHWFDYRHLAEKAGRASTLAELERIGDEALGAFASYKEEVASAAARALAEDADTIRAALALPPIVCAGDAHDANAVVEAAVAPAWERYERVLLRLEVERRGMNLALAGGVLKGSGLDD